MNKFLKFTKERYTLISFIIMSFFLLLSCFFEPCAYVVGVICVLLAIFLNYENILLVVLYTYPFQLAFNILKVKSVYNYLLLAMMLVAGIKYLIELFKKNKKINLKTIFPIGAFIIFLILPFHKVGLSNLVNYIVILSFVYLTYEYKNEISFKRITLALFYGLAISSLFYVFSFKSARMLAIIPKVLAVGQFNIIRYSVLFGHPNSLAMYALVTLVAVSALKYKKDITNLNFCIVFFISFIIGFLSISRVYVISLAILLVLFMVLYIIKNKTKCLKFVGIFSLIFLATLGCFYNYTEIYLVRFDLLPESVLEQKYGSADILYPPEDNKGLEVGSDEWWENVNNGEIHYDPGRSGIYKLYLNDWKSSVKSILFGKGISASSIGQMRAHNLLIQMLWTHGIIGCLLLLIIFLLFINFKLFKQNFCILLLCLLPLFVNFMVESPPLIMELISLVLLIVVSNKKDINNLISRCNNDS